MVERCEILLFYSSFISVLHDLTLHDPHLRQPITTMYAAGIALMTVGLEVGSRLNSVHALGLDRVYKQPEGQGAFDDIVHVDTVGTVRRIILRQRARKSTFWDVCTDLSSTHISFLLLNPIG